MKEPTGFVDLQVNGYQGVSFSSESLTAAEIARVSRELAQAGTAAFCSTVVTSSWATYEHVLPLLAAAIKNGGDGARMLGVHMEGPFISPLPGAVGVHPKEHVRAPDIAELDRLFELSQGTLKVLTVAPEVPGMPAFIRHAVELGVTVSVGHTMAGADDVQRAVEAGATLCTHLGNGCPNEIHRHDNSIWAQLGSSLKVMMISDGEHLPPAVIRAFMRARPADELIVTSDAAPVAGFPPGEYECFGSHVRITESGRVENLDAPTLAGSSARMLNCLNHLADLGYRDEDLLWKLGVINPLAAIGLSSEDVDWPASSRVVWDGTQFQNS
jgi:N-acetylglucosamine-6-phosphate deacetylase